MSVSPPHSHLGRRPVQLSVVLTGSTMANRYFVTGLLLVAAVACLVSSTVAISASERTAILDFYVANANALNNLPVPWTSDTTLICGDASNPAWSGIGCDASKSTILSLALSAPLNGFIPNSIGGLHNLTYLVLASCGLTGTVPASLGTIDSLIRVDLHSNALQLCNGATPTWPASLVTCDVHNQDINSCGTGCCGCVSSWSPACYSDVPACKACTGAPPHQFPDAACSNGRWVIQGSYTGSLTVNGSVLVVGDYFLPATKSLLFLGLTSQLNVTGKATLREGVTVVFSDAEIKALQRLGFLRISMTYLTAGVAQSTTQSGGGKGAVIYGHTKQKCKRPFSYSSGDSKIFTASFRYATTCNTWWIIVLCCLPSMIGLCGGMFAIFI